MSCTVLPKHVTGQPASKETFNPALEVADANFEWLESQISQLSAICQNLREATGAGFGDMLRSNYANTSTTVVDKAFALRIPSEEYNLPGEDVYSHLNNTALHRGGSTLAFAYDIVETRQFTPAYTVSWGRGIYNLRSTNGYPLTISVSVDSGGSWRVIGNSNSFVLFVQNGYRIVDLGGYYPQTEVLRIISW